ncbi:SCO family protein [Neomegalonema sp.]|uniref:SCO family protein n=1 Tax=Neomegalonema sp. TaxID=2039713 RepID=UPI00261222FE|nr:SCO family protein [Neomegalonema sp.]MDD2867370.1 SCO family protein [Neomegalonema sp.]
MRNPLFRTLTIGLWVLALAAVAWVWFGAPRGQPLAADELGRGAYRLTTHEGRPFTEADLRGAPSLVFFGFTHCPDVCPTTLADIGDWRDLAGKEIRTFFITVDPERDTPEVLAEYVGWLPGALGVTGPRPEIEAALRAFRVFASKGQVDEKGDYAMDHSSSVLMFSGEGRFMGTIPWRASEAEAVGKIKALM